MSASGSRRGFTRIGSADLRKLGLPAREARRLRLDRAWTIVAGDAIARRARPSDVRRGVVAVEIPDPAWARELAPLLPKLVARLALEYPDLGIRKLRTVVAGETVDRAVAIVPAQAEAPVPPRAPVEPAPSLDARAQEPPEPLSAGDLLDVASRYLERARERGRGR